MNEPTKKLVKFTKSLNVPCICFPRNIKNYKEYSTFHFPLTYQILYTWKNSLGKDLDTKIVVKNISTEYTKEEIKILKKLSEWPKCIEIASLKLEPHRIPAYLFELASEFHSYWNLGKDNPEKRFINKNKEISDDKLIFLKAISNIIKSGMDIVGVSTPEKM